MRFFLIEKSYDMPHHALKLLGLIETRKTYSYLCSSYCQSPYRRMCLDIPTLRHLSWVQLLFQTNQYSNVFVSSNELVTLHTNSQIIFLVYIYNFSLLPIVLKVPSEPFPVAQYLSKMNAHHQNRKAIPFRSSIADQFLQLLLQPNSHKYITCLTQFHIARVAYVLHTFRRAGLPITVQKY